MEQAHSLDIQSQQPYTSVCLKHDRHPERLSASGRKFVLAVPALPGAVSVPTADSQEICAWLCYVVQRPQALLVWGLDAHCPINCFFLLFPAVCRQY